MPMGCVLNLVQSLEKHSHQIRAKKKKGKRCDSNAYLQLETKPNLPTNQKPQRLCLYTPKEIPHSFHYVYIQHCCDLELFISMC